MHYRDTARNDSRTSEGLKLFFVLLSRLLSFLRYIFALESYIIYPYLEHLTRSSFP